MCSLPLISVVLPIYNVEMYLDRCMMSVIRQTYKNLEIVMVDDGSAEPCRQMCDEYSKKDSRIIVYHKKNGGLSDARNYGIQKSKGEYITCIDSDDYVDEDYIEYLFQMLCKYNTKMSVCQHRVHYGNGSIVEKGSSGDELIPRERCIERMLYHDVIDTSAYAKLYHRSLFDEVSYPIGKLFEDIATTYALMMQDENIAVGYETKYNYIFHQQSIVNSRFDRNKMDMIEMTDRMARDVLAAYPELAEAVLRRRVYSRFSTLNQMLEAEGWEEERAGIMNFIRSNTRSILRNKKAPRRDKVAVLLLNLNYPLYRFCWLSYRKKIMGNNVQRSRMFRLSGGKG